MQQLLIIFCLVFMVLLAATAVICRSMIRSAISLAAVSAVLAIVMFAMSAPWAALFELSVCSGLVTVIFISAISLTDPGRKSPEQVTDHKRRFSPLPYVMILAGVALIVVMMISGFAVAPIVSSAATAPLSFREALWNLRQADILGQIIIILAGAFAVVVLFKEGGRE